MSEDTNKESAGSTQSSVDSEKENFVPRSDHEKALRDLHEFKRKSREFEAQLEGMKESELKKNQQWEEYAKKKELEAEEAKTKAAKLEKTYLNDRKFSVVKDAVSKLGIRAEAIQDLEMLDLSEVTIETTSTGKLNVLGADKFAERLKALRPHWFGGSAPGVNVTDPKLNLSASVTVKQLLDAEKEAKKTGDSAKYQELHKRYLAQRK
jgi:hypothetical protein